jgi:hypothetical protein
VQPPADDVADVITQLFEVVSQVNPATQSSVEPQSLRQADPWHLYGEHGVFTPFGSTSVWSSLHVEPLTHLPVPVSQRFPSAQSVSAAQRETQDLPVQT